MNLHLMSRQKEQEYLFKWLETVVHARKIVQVPLIQLYNAFSENNNNPKQLTNQTWAI